MDELSVWLIEQIAKMTPEQIARADESIDQMIQDVYGSEDD